MGMSEHDEPVDIDKLSADWLRDQEYRDGELRAHAWAERLHIDREKRDDRRRRRSSWENWEDFPA